MTRVSDPSNAERRKPQVPIMAPLSKTGAGAVDAVIKDIYESNYLIDYNKSGENRDYLVYSAELKCSAQSGSKNAFLRMQENRDSYGNTIIGHGAVINGLPQANKKDSKAGINIDSFGECQLLKCEKEEVQEMIRTEASAAGCDICSYIRNLNPSWTTPSESKLMMVGWERAINLESFLMCNPKKIRQYKKDGVDSGKIQAVDSGQQNLDRLLDEYRNKYRTELVKSINTTKVILFSDFDIQNIYEFIYLYEIRYPERGRAFDNFYRNADTTFIDDMDKIKCMAYMAEEENVIKKMTEFMGKNNSIFININDILMITENGVTKESTAYFSMTADGNAFIEYPKISKARSYVPPYKTFFHEFGHGIDRLAMGAEDSCSVDFLSTQYAEKQFISASTDSMYVKCLKLEINEAKTIHEWAQFDVENTIVCKVCEILNAEPDFKDLSGEQKLYLGTTVIYDYLLFWNGKKKMKSLTDKGNPTAYETMMIALYKKTVNDINGMMVPLSPNKIPCLPQDIYGGITGDQIGGGHGLDYWFYDQGSNIGEQKRVISLEAFAGYFEYRFFNILKAINPEDVLHYTETALKEMYDYVL